MHCFVALTFLTRDMTMLCPCIAFKWRNTRKGNKSGCQRWWKAVIERLRMVQRKFFFWVSGAGWDFDSCNIPHFCLISIEFYALSNFALLSKWHFLFSSVRIISFLTLEWKNSWLDSCCLWALNWVTSPCHHRYFSLPPDRKRWGFVTLHIFPLGEFTFGALQTFGNTSAGLSLYFQVIAVALRCIRYIVKSRVLDVALTF